MAKADPAGQWQPATDGARGQHAAGSGRIVAPAGEGDLLTHCFNGKPNRILTPAGELRQAVREAIRRGLLLDIGHGSASFSFEVAELAIAQGILPPHHQLRHLLQEPHQGARHSLAHVMSKFFAIGMTLEQVLACVTHQAADALRLPGRGDSRWAPMQTSPCSR